MKAWLGPATMAGKPDVANGAFNGEYLLTFQGPWFFTGNKEEDIAKVQSGCCPLARPAPCPW